MQYLKELREKHKYTCQYKRDKLNISKPFYWQIDNDQRRLSYSMAIKIARIFNKKPDEIFYDELKNKD